MSCQKPPEPCCYIVHPLVRRSTWLKAGRFLRFPSISTGAPTQSRFGTVLPLVLAVFLQELHTVRPFHAPPGGALSWGIEHRAFARECCKVRSIEIVPASMSISDHRRGHISPRRAPVSKASCVITLYCVGVLQGFHQAQRLFLPMLARPLPRFWGFCTLARILCHKPHCTAL